VEGDEVARRRLLARAHCLIVVCTSTMVPVDLKHCGRLETVEFIAGQFAFVYETCTDEFGDNGVRMNILDFLGYSSRSKADLDLHFF
jgi:hypothetical protein